MGTGEAISATLTEPPQKKTSLEVTSQIDPEAHFLGNSKSSQLDDEYEPAQLPAWYPKMVLKQEVKMRNRHNQELLIHMVMHACNSSTQQCRDRRITASSRPALVTQ